MSSDLMAERIFGGVDARKLRSSMTLFDAARPGTESASGPGSGVFALVLDRFYAGEPDPATLRQL